MCSGYQLSEPGMSEKRPSKAAVTKTTGTGRSFAILENFPEAILVHDADMILYANRFAQHILGYPSPETLAGISLSEIFPAGHAAPQPERMPDWENGEAADRPMTYQVSRKDGTFLSVQVLSAPIRFRGKAAWQTILRDVTALVRIHETLKKNEHELNTLFEILPVGVAIMDQNRNIMQTNSRLKEILPIPPDDSYSNKHLQWKFLRQDGTLLPITEIPSFRALHERLRINDFIVGVLMPDDTTKWVSISAAPLPDSRAVVVTMDVTERKNDQRVLLQQISRIEETERRRFAADIHDDLGPTLSAMHLQADLLSRSSDPDGHTANLDILKDLLREVSVKVHMISHNILPHLLEDFGLEAAVRDFIRKMQRNKSFSFLFKSNLKKVRFLQDTEVHFYRIICELVNNSIKHSGGNRIRIQMEYDHRMLTLIYSDNGKGYDIGERLKEAAGMGLSNMMYRLNLMNATITWTKKNGRQVMRITKRLSQRPDSQEKG